jgi:hypothetical protein
MQSSNRWLYVRMAIIILSALSARFVIMPQHPDFEHPAPWYFPFVIAGFMSLGIPFALSIQGLSSRSSEKWQKPSWLVPPFSIKQPLVSFDMTAYCIIAYGFTSALMGLSTTPNNWSWEISVSAGIGVWIGVRLCMFIYRNRIET